MEKKAKCYMFDFSDVIFSDSGRVYNKYFAEKYFGLNLLLRNGKKVRIVN